MVLKKKVAIVVSSLNVGGAESMVTQLVSNICQEDLEIQLFVLSCRLNNHLEDYLDKKKVAVKYLDIQGRVTLKKYFLLNKELKKFNPNLLHIHLDRIYSVLWSILNCKKVIFTVHSQPFRIYNKKFKLLFNILIKREMIKFIGVSDAITSEAIKIFEIDRNLIETIYNPVNLKKFQNSRKFIEGNITFVNVARFHPIKNHKLLIESFAITLKEHSTSKLLLAGVGELLEEMKQLVKNLNIDHAVAFLGNVVDVEKVLLEGDIFVLSSDSEALPMTLLEAMASGLPIISTAVGGIPDVVTENGILVKTNDKESLSNSMSCLASNKLKREQMSSKSIEIVKVYSIEKTVQKYQLLYSKILNGN